MAWNGNCRRTVCSNTMCGVIALLYRHTRILSRYGRVQVDHCGMGGAAQYHKTGRREKLCLLYERKIARPSPKPEPAQIEKNAELLLQRKGAQPQLGQIKLMSTTSVGALLCTLRKRVPNALVRQPASSALENALRSDKTDTNYGSMTHTW